MTKKVRDCIICGAPTVSDNKLCKRTECHIERQKRRIQYITEQENDKITSKSGNYMSLRNCKHDVALEDECDACDDEWKEVISERNPPTYDDLPSNPRIKVK
jgi:hypothetical protein